MRLYGERAQISAYVEKSLSELLAERAQREGRSVSAVLRDAVKEYLTAK